MKLVLASQNKKKLVEMNDILSGLGIEVCSQAEAGVNLEPEETGSTFEENSLIKARAVMEASGLPAIADDSGLCVDALKGAPGVYSARYGGDGLDDVARYRLLLENMQGFGYDPVFFVPPLKKTFAQLTPEEKNAISHRGKALKIFQEKLEVYLRSK